MFYLEVEAEDDDYGYFSFSSLDRAVRYIKEKSLVDYRLSDNPLNWGVEYTHIED